MDNQQNVTGNDDDKNKNLKPTEKIEINPAKLDENEIDLDRDGIKNDQAHEPYEFGEQNPSVDKSDANGDLGAVKKDVSQNPDVDLH